MRSRILVVPAVGDMDSFGQLMAHLGHYLGHVECERIVVPVDRALLDRAEEWLNEPALPPIFHASVPDRIRQIRDTVVLRPWPSSLQPPAITSDVVIDWDVNRTVLEPWATIKSQNRPNRTLFEVDWRGTRLGASWFAELAKVLTDGRSFNQEGAEGLYELFARLGTADNTFLIGTGPSARDALDHDLSGGIRIVCNTLVLDQELMDHVRPHVVTFADPIFHFGPSTYAERFQEAVVEQAARHDFMIVTTERFVPLLRAHVPTLADRVVGLRQGTTQWVDNFELLRHPAVRPYPNVLTMLMLPLAATFSRSIGLIGFDGRAPEETYFWRHGTTVQFGKELEEIKQVHPGFFDLDYSDYYSTHVTQLEGIIRRIESRGIEVRSLTNSYMAPLRRRSDPPIPVLGDPPDVGKPRLFSLTPDWIDDFGHFGPFERRLHQAAEEAGLEHMSLASAGLVPDEAWQVPVFTDPSTSVGGGKFFDETMAVLEKAGLQPGSIVIFYAADIWHVCAILAVAREYPQVRFVANLMRAHVWVESALNEQNPWARGLAELLRICFRAAQGTNVDITVDTAALAQDIQVLVGGHAEVWPMTAVSLKPGNYSGSNSPRAPGFHVVSPVHAHNDKGFPDVAALAGRLRGKIERGDISLTVRHAPQPVPLGKGIDSSADLLVESGANLVRENLSDEEYVGLIESADVVLIPYRVNPFRTRTSGVVLDALMAGKPVVSVRGTWAGELVERYGAGVTYSDGDIDEMREAIEHVINRLDRYRERMQVVQEEVAQEFAPDRLVEFLMGRVGSQAEPLSKSSVEDVVARAAMLRDLYRWRAANHEAHLIDLAIVYDDRRRAHENSLDRLGTMEKALEWHRRSTREVTTKDVDLKRLTYSRSAGARLDESALVAFLIDPAGHVGGDLVDVGAHHGTAFSHFLERGWGVHAFEPDARHYEHLVGRYGSDERVHLDPRAVTSTSGEMRAFYTSGESTGVSALAPFLDSHVMAGSVETVALRDVLGDLHVNVLKVDTEGFDLAVLEGFPWERDLPEVVICEFEDRKTKPLGYTTSDLADFLVERGYQVWMSEWHPVVRYGIQHEWHRLALYPCEPSTPEAWGNFVAFKHPRSERTLASALAACLRVDNPDEQSDSGQTPQASRTPQASQTPQTLQPGGVKADRREAKVPMEHGRALVKRNPPLGHRQELRLSLKGQLGPVLGAASFLASLTAGLAIVGEEGWALAAGAAGIAATVLGIVVVAARIERRTR